MNRLLHNMQFLTARVKDANSSMNRQQTDDEKGFPSKHDLHYVLCTSTNPLFVSYFCCVGLIRSTRHGKGELQLFSRDLVSA